MFAIFAGQNSKGNFQKTVYRILSQKIPLSHISKGKINTNGKITAIFELSPESITCQKDDIVILNGCPYDAHINGEKYLIFNSSNKADIEISKNSCGEIITCGMSIRDTVTFSSFAEETCVFNLQRQITRLNGEKVQPFELPVICKKSDDRYALLVSYLILIILGYI